MYGSVVDLDCPCLKNCLIILLGYKIYKFSISIVLFDPISCRVIPSLLRRIGYIIDWLYALPGTAFRHWSILCMKRLIASKIDKTLNPNTSETQNSKHDNNVGSNVFGARITWFLTRKTDGNSKKDLDQVVTNRKFYDLI